MDLGCQQDVLIDIERDAPQGHGDPVLACCYLDLDIHDPMMAGDTVTFRVDAAEDRSEIICIDADGAKVGVFCHISDPDDIAKQFAQVKTVVKDVVWGYHWVHGQIIPVQYLLFKLPHDIEAAIAVAASPATKPASAGMKPSV